MIVLKSDHAKPKNYVPFVVIVNLAPIQTALASVHCNELMTCSARSLSLMKKVLE